MLTFGGDYGYCCQGVMVFFIFESRVLTFIFRLRKLTFSSDLLGKFFGGFIECQLQGVAGGDLPMLCPILECRYMFQILRFISRGK